ncbi:MAG: hypothetical protein H0Z33_11135 [Bacillaceae bacterium]|nr:hypothetical protein [Bacillaceae bacterium]
MEDILDFDSFVNRVVNKTTEHAPVKKVIETCISEMSEVLHEGLCGIDSPLGVIRMRPLLGEEQ